ncbi:hypothetical protein JL722_372 [Aureococcus anophagefferens]|nr:hypothetical protein JL722_372 [Aureococcus anophagefferens]
MRRRGLKARDAAEAAGAKRCAAAEAARDELAAELEEARGERAAAEKYSVLVQTYKNQIKEKQDKITNLEARVRTDRTAQSARAVVSAI